jgi:hypothetical protein
VCESEAKLLVPAYRLQSTRLPSRKNSIGQIPVFKDP